MQPMLEHVNLDKVLFIDIETVPQSPGFKNLDTVTQDLWRHKSQFLKRGESDTEEDIYHRAGIYAEFGKIICVSVGYFIYQDKQKVLKLRSFYGDDETSLLTDFSSFLSENFNKSSHLLCAHNGKEFDFPYLCRRLLVNGLKLPSILNIAGKKPWEIQHLDTMDLWRFGDYKSFTPLNLLASIFNIPSPKEDIDGSIVWSVYWVERDIERIVNYCQKDVITTVRLLLSMKGAELLADESIVFEI